MIELPEVAVEAAVVARYPYCAGYSAEEMEKLKAEARRDLEAAIGVLGPAHLLARGFDGGEIRALFRFLEVGPTVPGTLPLRQSAVNKMRSALSIIEGK